MFYKNNIDICNDKQMFEFLKTHFMYDIMNSWNRSKSIANNVKLYNLNLSGDWSVALKALEKDRYFYVSSMIEDWEAEHPSYEVYFNGRSGGYLVLKDKNYNGNVLPAYIVDGDYDEYKQYAKDYYGGLKYCRCNLRSLVKVVRDFDKLCDEIRNYVDELSNIDFVREYLEGVVEEFNESYYPDLYKWKATPLEVSEDNKIYITEIKDSPAMKKCLRDLLSDLRDYGYSLVFEKEYFTIEEN